MVKETEYLKNDENCIIVIENTVNIQVTKGRLNSEQNRNTIANFILDKQKSTDATLKFRQRMMLWPIFIRIYSFFATVN